MGPGGGQELEPCADRVIDLYTEPGSNFKRAVIARQVIGPYEMERELGLLDGNIFHGELSVDQLFHLRPAPGYADYRTAILTGRAAQKLSRRLSGGRSMSTW